VVDTVSLVSPGLPYSSAGVFSFGLLLPHPALNRLELLLCHSVAGREIPGVDLGIDLNPRVCGDPRLGKLDSLVDGDTVGWTVSITGLGAVTEQL
jgi:hypothetical protein